MATHEHFNKTQGGLHLYPMRCAPALKQALWGGNKLKTVLFKSYEEPKMAESWELSCHEDGLSGVANGEYAGRLLKDVLKEHPEFVGSCVQHGEEFPLLVKFIDANDDLSIQVHPTKEGAIAALGQKSKTEIWIVMDSAPDSTLYCGFNREITAQELISRAKDGGICEVLNKVPARKGDVFHIHAGTMHAIGSGLLIAEIQQSANTTFRVYDFMRRDASGNMRPLHVEEAARTADFKPIAGKPADILTVADNAAYAHDILFDSPLFYTERYTIRERVALVAEDTTFEALLFIEGQGSIRHNGEVYTAKKGDCYFIPAGMGRYDILGPCCVLRNRILRKEGMQ